MYYSGFFNLGIALLALIIILTRAQSGKSESRGIQWLI